MQVKKVKKKVKSLIDESQHKNRRSTSEFKSKHQEIIFPIALVDMIGKVAKERHVQMYEFLKRNDEWKIVNYLVLTNK